MRKAGGWLWGSVRHRQRFWQSSLILLEFKRLPSLLYGQVGPRKWVGRDWLRHGSRSRIAVGGHVWGPSARSGWRAARIFGAVRSHAMQRANSSEATDSGLSFPGLMPPIPDIQGRPPTTAHPPAGRPPAPRRPAGPRRDSSLRPVPAGVARAPSPAGTTTPELDVIFAGATPPTTTGDGPGAATAPLGDAPPEQRTYATIILCYALTLLF